MIFVLNYFNCCYFFRYATNPKLKRNALLSIAVTYSDLKLYEKSHEAYCTLYQHELSMNLSKDELTETKVAKCLNYSKFQNVSFEEKRNEFKKLEDEIDQRRAVWVINLYL